MQKRSGDAGGPIKIGKSVGIRDGYVENNFNIGRVTNEKGRLQALMETPFSNNYVNNYVIIHPRGYNCGIARTLDGSNTADNGGVSVGGDDGSETNCANLGINLDTRDKGLTTRLNIQNPRLRLS